MKVIDDNNIITELDKFAKRVRLAERKRYKAELIKEIEKRLNYTKHKVLTQSEIIKLITNK